MVAGRVDGSIAQLDPDTLQEQRALPAARSLMGAMRFSGDGTVLIGPATDGNVSFYDAAAGIRLGDAIDLGANLADVNSAGTTAMTSRSDGQATLLWNLDPQQWVTAACAIAGRNLSREEWAAFIGDLGPYRATCPEFPTG